MARAGQGTSARNSQVVHGGMYYPKGSLKAECCVKGRRELYQFCRTHNVELKRREKLIVATSEAQVAALQSIFERSLVNGLTAANGDGLEWLSGEEARALEPELRCVRALRSPATGVLDGHGYLTALVGDFEGHGGAIAFNTLVQEVLPPSDGASPGTQIEVVTEDGYSTGFDMVINCAGLYAVEVARRTRHGAHDWLPKARFAKGNYFKLEGCRTPFRRLIYPVPEEAGLGVHVTVDIGGQARFGPDVEWLSVTDPAAIDYSVDPARANSFYDAIRAYWPGLPDKSLEPDFSGVRPKVDSPGVQDFAIYGPMHHKSPGLVHAIGIESPGLTSSLALGELLAGAAAGE